jgi:hypothetical protein
MTEQDIYNAKQEYKQYQEIMNTKNYLTQEEYDFCFYWDHQETCALIFKLSEGKYLNLNVYSEVDHDDKQYRMECGL